MYRIVMNADLFLKGIVEQASKSFQARNQQNTLQPSPNIYLFGLINVDVGFREDSVSVFKHRKKMLPVVMGFVGNFST